MSDTAPAPVNQGWVVMFNPKLDGPNGHVYTEVTRDAYDLVWKAKGFELAEAPTVAAAQTQDVYAGMVKADLVDAAKAAGIDSTGTADELRERLTAHAGGGA